MGSRRVKRTPHAGHAGPLRDFIREVDQLAKSGRDHREVLQDFLELGFCAVSRPTLSSEEARDERERQYMDLVRKRPAEYIRAMPKLLAMLQAGIEEHGDFLGLVAGELGALSEGLGQFFSPYGLCRVMAETQLEGADDIIAERGYVTIGEPACGAGGMLLAAAQVLEERQHNVRACMLAHAQDVSPLAVRACYLHLALRGVPAVVVQGDTLRMQVWSQDVTPAWFEFQVHARMRANIRALKGEAPAEPVDVKPEPMPATAAQVAFDFGGARG